MHTYDVALWVVFPSIFPEYVDLVEASHAYEAIQLLMVHHGLKWVARAGARSIAGVPQRWNNMRLEMKRSDSGNGHINEPCVLCEGPIPCYFFGGIEGATWQDMKWLCPACSKAYKEACKNAGIDRYDMQARRLYAAKYLYSIQVGGKEWLS